MWTVWCSMASSLEILVGIAFASWEVFFPDPDLCQRKDFTFANMTSSKHGASLQSSPQCRRGVLVTCSNCFPQNYHLVSVWRGSHVASHTSPSRLCDLECLKWRPLMMGYDFTPSAPQRKPSFQVFPWLLRRPFQYQYGNFSHLPVIGWLVWFSRNYTRPCAIDNNCVIIFNSVFLNYFLGKWL